MLITIRQCTTKHTNIADAIIVAVYNQKQYKKLNISSLIHEIIFCVGFMIWYKIL